jgi:hypothetical protein
MGIADSLGRQGTQVRHKCLSRYRHGSLYLLTMHQLRLRNIRSCQIHTLWPVFLLYLYVYILRNSRWDRALGRRATSSHRRKITTHLPLTMEFILPYSFTFPSWFYATKHAATLCCYYPYANMIFSGISELEKRNHA